MRIRRSLRDGSDRREHQIGGRRHLDGLNARRLIRREPRQPPMRIADAVEHPLEVGAGCSPAALAIAYFVRFAGRDSTKIFDG